MDGQRAVVEEIGGTVDKLQMVDHAEASILRLQVDAHHSTRRGTELPLCELVERIILQAYIVDTLDLRQSLKFAG